MSKIKQLFRGRKWLRNLVTILLCLVVVGGVVGGVVALTRNTDKIDEALTYKSIGWTKYSIGGLASNGSYMSTDQSIYTEKAFECQGLNVTPVFDSTVSYQIYFYDQNNEFVHTTGRLTGTFVQDSVPFFAKYARIVITPNDDNKVTIFEKAKYAKQIEVKIYREQGFKNYTEDLFETDVLGYVNKTTGVIDNTNTSTAISKSINILAYNEFLVFRLSGVSPDLHNYWIAVYNGLNEYIGHVDFTSAQEVFTSSQGYIYYSIPMSLVSAFDGATFVRFISVADNLIGVFCR